MEPPQLGTLSPSFLQQCAHEAPQLSGTLPSTTFPTKPQSSLLWATTATAPPPTPEQGLREGRPTIPPHSPESWRPLALP